MERVRNYIDNEDEILEIGCASGYFLDAIAPVVKKVYGTEWDDRSLKYIEENSGFSVKRNIDEYKKKFNKIFMFHVLEHIPDPIIFLKLIKKYLSDDGILFIEVPNADDMLISGYDLQEFKDFYYQSAHLWYFNESSILYVLEKSGFSVELKYIQRYDLSNHLYWLKEKRPGGQEIYRDILSDDLNLKYKEDLIKNKRSDTIFAVCSKKNK